MNAREYYRTAEANAEKNETHVDFECGKLAFQMSREEMIELGQEENHKRIVRMAGKTSDDSLKLAQQMADGMFRNQKIYIAMGR